MMWLDCRFCPNMTNLVGGQCFQSFLWYGFNFTEIFACAKMSTMSLTPLRSGFDTAESNLLVSTMTWSQKYFSNFSKVLSYDLLWKFHKIHYLNSVVPSFMSYKLFLCTVDVQGFEIYHSYFYIKRHFVMLLTESDLCRVNDSAESNSACYWHRWVFFRGVIDTVESDSAVLLAPPSFIITQLSQVSLISLPLVAFKGISGQKVYGET